MLEISELKAFKKNRSSIYYKISHATTNYVWSTCWDKINGRVRTIEEIQFQLGEQILEAINEKH
jgi:hypothetical protein